MQHKFNFYFKINWLYKNFLNKHKLKSSEISLYWALLFLANQNNEETVKITQENLVKLCGVSRKYINKNILRLVEVGLIEKINSSQYKIVIDNIEPPQQKCDNNMFNNLNNNLESNVLNNPKPNMFNSLYDNLEDIVI